jgi:hypothetical protein
MFAPNQIMKTAAPDPEGSRPHGRRKPYLLDLAAEVKAPLTTPMPGKKPGMLKAFAPHQAHFELAMKQMGGGSVFLEGPIGICEPPLTPPANSIAG